MGLRGCHFGRFILSAEQVARHLGRKILRKSALQSFQEHSVHVAVGINIACTPGTRFEVKHSVPLPSG